MNAIRPEINLSLFGRKKKVVPETASTEDIIDNAIGAAKTVATDTVAIAEEAAERVVVKLLVGAVLGGAALIAANTVGKIIVNALDNRNN